MTSLGLIIYAVGHGNTVLPASHLVCVSCLWLVRQIRVRLRGPLDMSWRGGSTSFPSRVTSALDQARENEGGSADLTFLSASTPTCPPRQPNK